MKDNVSMDLEGLDTIIESIKDFAIDVKASFKATLQKLKQYDGFHKENRNELKQFMTRFDLSKEKRIIVADNIVDFLHKHLTTAQTEDDIVRLLTANIDDFNTDIINKFGRLNTTINTVEKMEKFLNELLSTNKSNMDTNAYTVIEHGMTNATKDDISKLKSGKAIFIVGYLLNRKIKGIWIEDNKIDYVTFKIEKDVSLPTVLPLSLFDTIYTTYQEDNKSNVRDSIKLYKELVKNSSKLYKVTDRVDDERVLTYLKQIEKVMVEYGNGIIDHTTDVRTYQKDFLYAVLDGFEITHITGHVQ